MVLMGDRMFRILICDDELDVCNQIEQAFKRYAEKREEDIHIEQFYSGESLIQYMENNSQKNVDLIFLDIKLPGMTGVKVGKLLREKLENEKVQIVFISAYEQYAMQLFQIRPFDFLLKPVNENAVIKIFEKYIRLFVRQQEYFEYKIGKSTEKILSSEIMYFECLGRKKCIVTPKERIYFYGNIKDIRKAIHSKHFWTVHNSFIINTQYVKAYKENEIVMCNDQVIHISNTYKKEIKRKIAAQGEV